MGNPDTSVLSADRPRVEGSPWWSLLWAAIGAGVGAFMAPLEPSFLEEGLMLHIAERLVGGEHLYRDVHAVTGPIPYEMLAHAFRLFGEEIAVARWLIVAMQALSTGLIFDWARRTGAGPLSHAAAACMASAPVLLFPLYTLFFYTTVAYHFCVYAGYAALRLLEASGSGSRVAWGLAAGALVAAAALCKQTLGAVLALTLVVAVVAAAASGRRVRDGGLVIAGGVLATLVTLAFYFARGELGVVLDALAVRPFSLGDAYASPYMNLWPLGEFTDEIRANRLFYVPQLYNLFYPSVFTKVGRGMILLTQFVFVLPILALGISVLVRCFYPLRAGVWIHAALLVAFLANLFPRADWGHLVVVLPSAVVQLLLVLYPGTRVAPPVGSAFRGPLALVASAVVIAAFALGTGAAGQSIYAISTEPQFGARVPQRPVSIMTRNSGAARVVGFLRDHVTPGEPIFVARSEPFIYFATGTTNPTPFGGVLTGYREEQERILLPALEKVRFVVMSDRDQPLYTYYSDEVPAVQEMLERHFDVPPPFVGLDNRESWIFVLERSVDRGPTRIDFFDQRANGRYWLRSGNGQNEPATRVPPRLAAHYNRRPLAMPMGLRGGGVDFDIVVPDNSVFQGDVGLKEMTSKDNFFSHPHKSRLIVAIRRQGEVDFERLHTEEVFQHNFSRVEGRYWTPVEVDLSAYSGEAVTLRLGLESDLYIKPGSLAWFGSPRLAGGRSEP